jgi:uroporphyrin-III C-methyltransferase/precorrin-2 dehydrogenase/sirohydrochlorin ferrochelatase
MARAYYAIIPSCCRYRRYAIQKFLKSAAGVVFNKDEGQICQPIWRHQNRLPVVKYLTAAQLVLAQVIRQRIDSILPENLGAWGALAKRLRSRITHAIHEGKLRRAVWQRFAGLAMAGANPADHNEHSLLASLLETIPQQIEPTILEVPEDREQMTLKSCRLLMNADVVHNYSGCDL